MSVKIEDLKRSINLVELFGSYGIEVKKKGAQHECRCPFHDGDDTPSLKITPDKGLWNCFGCDAGGSAVDLVMKMDKVDVAEARKILLRRVPHIAPLSTMEAVKSEKKEERAAPDSSLLTAIFDHAHKTLTKPGNDGLKYLKTRGLDDAETIRTFKLGFIDGSLRDLLPQNREAVAALQSIGFLNDKGNPSFYGCVVAPVWREDGSLGECFARGISDPRKLYLKGTHGGVFNGKALKVYDSVIVCEAVFDALALYSTGIRNVIATYGTNGWTEDHDALLSAGKARQLVFAFDGDKAGAEGEKRIVDRLKGKEGLSFSRLKIPSLDGVKDINELLLHLYAEGLGKDEVRLTFESLIASAPRIGKPNTHKESGLVLMEQTESDLHFTNCQLSYRLRGLFENSETSLKLVVTAETADHSHTDRFDLYSAKSRSGFAFHAAQRLDLPQPKLEDDLSKLIPKLETLLQETRSAPEKADEIPPMSAEEEKKALSFLTAPNLLGRIATDLGNIGYVGEQTNKQLAYLIGTSRRLTKPLSGIVRSESGAGKSFLMECVAELTPPEEVRFFSRLTSQSLYYMGREALQHKLLIVDERDGSAESEYPIRTLQSRRKLTLAVPMKNAKTGNIETAEVTILGPIAYMESTTSTEVNPENENRSFEIYLDESPKQTRRIFEAQKKAHLLSAEERAVKRQRIVERHHHAQRLLEPVTVRIPFAHLLDFPVNWTRGRRDIDRLLSLVEAITFLHQKQRERVGNAIEATPEDYAAAFDLAKSCLEHAWAELPRSASQLLAAIRKWAVKEAKKLGVQSSELSFRRREVRQITGLPDHIVKRGMRSLEDLEYVSVRRARNGGSFKYQLAGQPPAVNLLDGLTTPEQLKEKYAQMNTGTEANS
jgi:DNA primase catalytic core